ncbi:MAG: DUF1553 domain-containing protein, partial [Verrucomicrobiales bacterium]|nr:DUF1553 domain-containing protein [Verrucomicrobiales bacterium]
ALTLLNDPVFFECAEILGRSTFQSHGEKSEELIREIFLRCLNREPTAAEVATLESAHRDFLSETKNPELAGIALARVVMNLDEFISRD